MIIDVVVVGGANVIFITLLRRRTAHFSSKNFPDVIRDCFQLFVAVVVSPSWSLSRKCVLSITITTTSITICERRRRRQRQNYFSAPLSLFLLLLLLSSSSDCVCWYLRLCQSSLISSIFKASRSINASMLSNISLARACVALFALNACSNDDAFDAPPPPVAADGGTGDASSRWSFSSSLVLIIVSLLNALETALSALIFAP